MLNNKKIILLLIISALILGSGSYVMYFKKAQQVSQKITEKQQAPNDKNEVAQSTVIPQDNEVNVICKDIDIANGSIIRDGKQYIIRSKAADLSSVSHYNDYIFCKLFSNKSVDEVLLAKAISDNSANFSQQAFFREWFVKLKSLNNILKSSNCDSEEIDDDVKNYKHSILSPETKSAPADLPNNISSTIAANLEKITSADLCSFLKHTPTALEKINENFCAGNFECLAMLKDDATICNGYEFGDDKEMCSDNVWYLRALRKTDINICSNIKSSHKNIACQAYFLDSDPDMCNALANEIKKTFCKK